jgi:hypothetical protein
LIILNRAPSVKAARRWAPPFGAERKRVLLLLALCDSGLRVKLPAMGLLGNAAP